MFCTTVTRERYACAVARHLAVGMATSIESVRHPSGEILLVQPVDEIRVRNLAAKAFVDLYPRGLEERHEAIETGAQVRRP